ncbi:member of the karyopherin-beta [Paecilomyces lecythidis]
MSAGLGQTPDPQALVAEANETVTQLYDPANARNPTKVKELQEHLQFLQKSPQGWIIADGLMSSGNPDARFMGALTFIVKINQDWSNLAETEARELIERLINHFVLFAGRDEKPVVLRKLASSLVAIFLKPNAPWRRALWHLAACLAHGGYIPEDQSLSVDFQTAALPHLGHSQIVALLYFSAALAEEASKWYMESRRSGDDHPISENIEDALTLSEFVLSLILQQESPDQDTNAGPGNEAITSYNVWLTVRHSIRRRDPILKSRLASPTTRVIQSLRVPILSKAAAEVVTDLLHPGEGILNQEHVTSILQFIVSDIGSAHVVGLVEGVYDDEHMVFLELLLAYARLKFREILIDPPTPEHENVLTILHTLFHGPGYAAVDDEACPYLLEWWTEIADEIQEVGCYTEQSLLYRGKQNLARAVLDCFAKLIYPEPLDIQSWGDDEKIEFNTFRRDVCDFLLATYPILGIELIQVFQEKAKSAMESQDWRTFEAAIFCLGHLSEAVDENEHADQCLNAIFFTDEFATICAGQEVQVPDKARQTLVDMLGRYKSFFERTHALISPVLNFLFSSLDVASCATAASKSISFLCKSCRQSLTGVLPTFLDQFDQFRMKPTATVQNMERVLEGIAAIVQTLPTDADKAECLERLLRFFQSQAEVARAEAVRGETETAQSHAYLVLRCVASIGKGLRADGDAIVDLDRDITDPYPATFWNTGPGAIPQTLIMQCMHILVNDFPINVDIIEAACDILKAGYTEKNGPYVFPPVATVNFVKSIPLGSPGADIVMGTASAFLASHRDHPEQISNEAVALIMHVYETFCWMLENPQYNDPEISNSGIDFLTRLLPKYHPILFSLTSAPSEPSREEINRRGGTGLLGHSRSQRPILETIISFTFIALSGADPLPLRSASQFWVSVLNLPIGREANASQAVEDALKDCLPTLCQILVAQLAGRCARSDIDHLAGILKRLIFRQQGAARLHLSVALASLGSDSSQSQGAIPSPQDRERFLAMIIAARGSAKTTELVRTFWKQCRGAGFDYAE